MQRLGGICDPYEFCDNCAIYEVHAPALNCAPHDQANKFRRLISFPRVPKDRSSADAVEAFEFY
jgi:hypothetical protein